jgi:hypothetical protein
MKKLKGLQENSVSCLTLHNKNKKETHCMYAQRGEETELNCDYHESWTA